MSFLCSVQRLPAPGHSVRDALRYPASALQRKRDASMTDVVAGRYALCDPIGVGGTGTVWRAYDRKVDAYCAAELLRQRDAGELLRFVREQSVRLAHPHIVSPYSWAAEDGTVLWRPPPTCGLPRPRHPRSRRRS